MLKKFKEDDVMEALKFFPDYDNCDEQDTEPPKEFWKYYDLYRRKKLSLEEFSKCSEIEIHYLVEYLKCI